MHENNHTVVHDKYCYCVMYVYLRVGFLHMRVVIGLLRVNDLAISDFRSRAG